MKRSTSVVLCSIAIISFFATCYSVIYLNKRVELYKKSMDARQVMLKQDNGYLMWKYDDEESNWENLYNLSQLKGKDGLNGKNGTDGKDGINGLNGKDGADGKDGINGLNGKDGADGKDGINGLNGKDGADGKDGINGLNGENGVNGREVEFRVNGNIVQWRYVGNSDWNDLLNINTAINTAKNNIVNSVNGNFDDLGCYTNGNLCSPGTIMNIKVNDNQNYDFYVVKDNCDSLILIMNSNIVTNEFVNCSWHSYTGSNSLGPDVALSYLNNLTSSWTNIDVISSYTYSNSGNGYKSLAIENGNATIIREDNTSYSVESSFRARLLTYEEVSLFGCTNGNNSCPGWLYNNLSGSDGYWLFTTSSNTTDALNINSGGNVGSTDVGDPTFNGIRPVITIKK